MKRTLSMRAAGGVPPGNTFRCGNGRIRCDLSRSSMEWSRRNIHAVWEEARPAIEQRLDEFRCLWQKASDKELFTELAFCLFTPQSKATNCWETVQTLRKDGLLFTGTMEELAHRLNRVRFRHHKACYVIEARRLFSTNGRYEVRKRIAAFPSAYDAREWLVEHVKGLGYKEASHFLRNIGLGEDIAILDRHILKNLHYLGAISEIPQNLTKTRYLETEAAMQRFAKNIAIPLGHLDLLMWCRETGEIFK